MKIEFVKAHPSGIPVGAVHTVRESFGNRMIADEYAMEVVGQPAAEVIPEPEMPPIADIITVEEVIPETVENEPEQATTTEQANTANKQ